MNFNPLSAYKEKVLSKLLASEEISEALSASDKNPEASLLYHNIYPYLYIPDVLTEEKTFICMDCTVPRLESATTKEVNIILIKTDPQKFFLQIQTGKSLVSFLE